MQILIVEDDFISRRLLSRYLSPLGTCDMAINGEEALAAVKTTLQSGDHYDLVCLDIMMPGISGHEVLAGIRKIEDALGLPVDDRCKVVMTTALEQEDKPELRGVQEPDDYVVKPIVKREFMGTLEKLGLTVPAE